MKNRIRTQKLPNGTYVKLIELGVTELFLVEVLTSGHARISLQVFETLWEATDAFDTICVANGIRQ